MGAAASATRTMREFTMAEMAAERTAPVFRETGAVSEGFALRWTRRGGEMRIIAFITDGPEALFPGRAADPRRPATANKGFATMPILLHHLRRLRYSANRQHQPAAYR